MFLYYWNNPEATKQFRDAEGWAHTGDLAYYNEEGYFKITNRIKELIKHYDQQVIIHFSLLK